VKAFSFRQLFGTNCAKITKYLLQEEEIHIIRSKSFLCINTETVTNTVLLEYERWRSCGIFCS